MTALAYGIDFGTSNTSISIAHDDQKVDVLTIDAAWALPQSLPSIAYLDRNGIREAGEEAVNQFLITGSNTTLCRACSLVTRDPDGWYSDCRQFSRHGGCHDSRLISGLKSELAETSFSATHSWARDFTLDQLVSIIVADVKRRADRHVGADVRRVVIGHPVVFSGAEGAHFETRQAAAEDRLARAAERAGFDEVRLYPEPAAVLLGQRLPDGITIAVDFGGGTFDATVLRIDGGEAEVIALQGAAIGGERFDAVLFDHKIADAIGLNQTVMGADGKGHFIPARIRYRMRTLAGVHHLLSDRYLRPAISALAVRGGDVGMIDAILHGGHAFGFYKAIESAKIELSTRSEAQIEFSRPGLRVSESVNRAEFESWIERDLDVVDDAILAALEEAGVVGDGVDTVLRTGGSSMIPAFVSRLENMFPNADIRERPAFTSVAYGLGMHALQEWSVSE